MKLNSVSIGILFTVGALTTLTSLLGMIILHEFAISEFTFIIGVVLLSTPFLFRSPTDKPLKINTDQVNKNIQNYNDLLWGKEKEKKEENTTIIIIKK